LERERLTRLVAEPEHVARGDLKDLHALAEQYPWFAGAQLLRSVGEQKAGDVRSEETLHTAAVHVPSRRVLFDLVAKTGLEERVPLVVVRKDDPFSLDGKRDEPTTELLPRDIEATPELSVPVPDPVPVQEIPDPDPSAPDPLELQIMEAAMASAYDLTWDTTAPMQPDSGLSGGSGEGNSDRTGLDQPPTEIDDPEEEGTKPFAEKEQAIEAGRPRLDPKTTRLRFTDWLELDQAVTVDKVTPVSALSEQRFEELGAGTKELKAEATVPAVLPKEPIGTKDLIDRFIQQQNPAAPTKVAFYTPQQAAKRSLDDTTGLVTETLARVYTKQGNLPKAIDAYHRLAIKYPVKSAYFAALAKELEGQLNR